jgi:hypothetical protein
MSKSVFSGNFDPIEFDDDQEKRLKQMKEFGIKCTDVKFVIECLERYQRYRRGVGEYQWNADPEKNLKMPFCPAALTIIENSAIKYLTEYSNMRDLHDEEVWKKLMVGKNPWQARSPQE